MLTVITGPPCSGKTSHVQRHANRGDIVVDFDLIAETLGSPVSHGHGSRHTHVAKVAWTAAVTAAIRCHGWGHTVWIVDAAPTERRTAEYVRAGARWVRLDAEPAVLHERARAARRPAATHERIDGWVGTPNPARSRPW